MPIKVLCITEKSDRPESETFVGLHREGVDIEVITHPDGINNPVIRDAGVPLSHLHIKKRVDPQSIRIIRDKLLKNGYDILHVFNNKALSNSLLASVGIPVKIVAYRGIVGNVSFFDPASWMTYLNPRVDRVVCVAEAIRQYFLKMNFLGLKLKQEKFVTIHKGHKIAWYQNPCKNLREFNIPEDAFVVGCIANIRPRKGIHVLIEAAEHLPADSSIHFLLIGNMESDPLKRQIEESPMRDRFHLTGFRQDAASIVGGCDVSVLPALKREGLPKVVIESMAYGVPAIVTDSGGSPELIEQGRSGLIVPPGDAKAIADAISTLYFDREKCRRMGAAAKTRIDRDFNNRQTVEKTLAVYNELVAG